MNQSSTPLPSQSGAGSYNYHRNTAKNPFSSHQTPSLISRPIPHLRPPNPAQSQPIRPLHPPRPVLPIPSRINTQQSANSHTNVPPSLIKKPLSMRNFEIGRRLGSGKYGKVLLVRHRATKFICALKMMSKQDLVKYAAETQFRREVEIQSSLRHENILQMYNYFEDEKRVYILIEHSLKGEMFRILNNMGRFPPVMATNYVCQVAAGLDYCHQNNVIHRDVKLENLLMGTDGKIKISDFGWSIRSRGKRPTFCGTLDYLAPELIANEAYGSEVDVWALGVLTYEFLVGNAPFVTRNRSETYDRINKLEIEFPSFVEPEAVDFIMSLLVKRPSARMALRDVPNHPWIRKHRKNW